MSKDHKTQRHSSSLEVELKTSLSQLLCEDLTRHYALLPKFAGTIKKNADYNKKHFIQPDGT